MKPKTLELLYFLLWSCDLLMRPNFRNLTDSFETWAYRNNLLRQLHELERQRLLERMSDEPKAAPVYRLTRRGVLNALGGRDPNEQWSRAWNNSWQFVLFDVPVGKDSERRRLRRYLHEEHFGRLQGSVWITPDLSPEQQQVLSRIGTNVNGLIVLNATSGNGVTNQDIVNGAWDFEKINSLYRAELHILKQWPKSGFSGPNAPGELRRWAAAEREAWSTAVQADPLLPKTLLPAGYMGCQAWQARVQILGEARSNLDCRSRAAPNK